MRREAFSVWKEQVPVTSHCDLELGTVTRGMRPLRRHLDGLDLLAIAANEGTVAHNSSPLGRFLPAWFGFRGTREGPFGEWVVHSGDILVT